MERPKAELVFSDRERKQLKRWSRWSKSAQWLAQRSRVMLAWIDRLDNTTSTARGGEGGARR